MNTRRLSVAVVAASLTVAACGAGGSESGTTSAAECTEQTFKFSFIASNTSTWQKAADEFAAQADKRTDGRVTVKTYAGGQLASGNQQTELQMTRQGVIDIQWISPIILALYLDKRFDVYSLPFLFANHDVANAVIDGPMGETSEQWLRDKDLEPLGWGVNGFRQITNSEREITEPSDVEGLQIRVAGTDLFQEIFSAMGAKPVTMNFGEVYTALEQGTIGGQENPLSIIYSSSLYSVQDYVSLWNYSYDPLVMIMNNQSYSSLCAKDQKALHAAGDKAGELQRKLTRQEDIELPKALEEKGMTVTPTDEIDIEAFQEITEPVYDKWSDEIGQDVVDQMVAEVEKAEKATQ